MAICFHRSECCHWRQQRQWRQWRSPTLTNCNTLMTPRYWYSNVTLRRSFSTWDWFFNLRSSMDKMSLPMRYVMVLYSSILRGRKAAEDLMKMSMKTWESRQTKELISQKSWRGKKKVADGSMLSGSAHVKPTGLKLMLKRQESEKHNLLRFGLFNLEMQETEQFIFHAEVLQKNYHAWITCCK